MDASEDRQKLYGGFSDALGKAVELVAVPVIFALMGHFLDGRFGTGKVLAIAFTIFAVVGMFVRAYYAYGVAMEAESEKAPWRKA